MTAFSRRTLMSATAGAGFSAMLREAAAGSIRPGNSFATDAANAGLIDDTVAEGMPGETFSLFPDLAFGGPYMPHMGLISSGTLVIGKTAGLEKVVLAADVRTGDEVWRIEGLSNVLGCTDELFFSHTAGDAAAGQSGLVEGRSLQDPTAIAWSRDLSPTGETRVVGDLVILTTATQLVALHVATGKTEWEIDTSSSPVLYLAADDNIVVGQDDVAGRMLAAWSMSDGALLWSIDAEFAFISAPIISDGKVIVATGKAVLSLDAMSGESVDEFEHGMSFPRQGFVVAHGDSLLLQGPQGVKAFESATGDVLWTYTSIFGTQLMLLATDDLVLTGALANDRYDSPTILEGLNANDGTPLFEIPSRTGEDGFFIADFTVVDGAIVLAGKHGLRGFRGTDDAYEGVSNPGQGNAYESADHGFRYEWDDSWEAAGTSFMTPDGLRFNSTVSGAVASQYVTDAATALTMDEDLSGLVVSYPSLFGPDTRYLRSAERLDSPDVSEFLPADAQTIFGRYETTLRSPFDVSLCLTVGIPLAEEQMLVFEFMTAESLFDEDLPTFWTFFENLDIDSDNE